MTHLVMHTYEFLAPILQDADIEDGYMKHYVPLPHDIAEELADAERLLGEIDGCAFRRTLQKRHNGDPCLRFGKAWLRNNRLQIGAVVPISLQIDPDPDRVDIPEELEEALLQDAKGAWAWAQLTPGRKRSFAYHITLAKRPETRARRAVELLKKIRDM